MKPVIVRFAPSPTGSLHIGGARTALFNWLFARHNKGKFILRIEDTDRQRSQKEFLDDVLDGLKWLGLDWDGQPCFQSKRLELYRRYTEKLVSQGKAYQAEGAVFFKVVPENVAINDLVHGKIEFDNRLLKDFVIQKSDGFPTYNFACVVDDYELKITHIIRGDDHISNTPKQLALYQALGLNKPEFAHIPLIMGPDKSPLSKRHGAASVIYYRREGYLPGAIVNFLALMGWSPGNNQEIIDKNEIVDKFSLDRVLKTSAIFNVDKLNWMNNQYIKKLDIEELINLLSPFLDELRKSVSGKDKVFSSDETKEKNRELAKLFQGRIKILSDIKKQADYFFSEEVQYTGQARERILKDKNTLTLFKTLIEHLKGLDDFSSSAVEQACRSLIKELAISSGDLIHPVRAALSGRTVTPGLFELIAILGKEKTIKRLEDAVQLIQGHA